jgi:hypothetical protein
MKIWYAEVNQSPLQLEGIFGESWRFSMTNHWRFHYPSYKSILRVIWRFLFPGTLVSFLSILNTLEINLKKLILTSLNHPVRDETNHKSPPDSATTTATHCKFWMLLRSFRFLFRIWFPHQPRRPLNWRTLSRNQFWLGKLSFNC